VNDKNYYFDTIRLTMFADKLVRKYKSENKKVSLVVDLSNNVGGTGFAECFIAS
jgi:C-terminal processing protease CtpA/Prc